MVKIDELKITPNGNDLFLQAHVDDISWYEDVYIKEVYILKHTQYGEFIMPDELTPDKYAFKWTPETPSKEIELDVASVDLNLKGNFSTGLWFVYIRCEGQPAAETPCGMDNEYTIGVVYNMENLYRDMTKSLIDLRKHLCNGCYVPEIFIDNFLLIEAIDAEIKAGNYVQAVQWYKEFIEKKYTISQTKTCGCNG